MNKWQPLSGTVTAGTLELYSSACDWGFRVFFLESCGRSQQVWSATVARSAQLERPLVWVTFSDATKASLESLAVEHKPDRDDLDAALHCAKV